MVSPMQTIEMSDLVSTPFVNTAFEACTVFQAGPEAAPICGGCGWLEAEHDRQVAEVRSLPRRAPARVAAPKRLAS
jgi:hypothetical protein